MKLMLKVFNLMILDSLLKIILFFVFLCSNLSIWSAEAGILARSPEAHLFRATIESLDQFNIENKKSIKFVPSVGDELTFGFEVDRLELANLMRKTKEKFVHSWDNEQGLDLLGIFSIPSAAGVYWFFDRMLEQPWFTTVTFAFGVALAGFKLSEALDEEAESEIHEKFSTYTAELNKKLSELEQQVFVAGNLMVDTKSQEKVKDENKGGFKTFLNQAIKTFSSNKIFFQMEIDPTKLKNRLGDKLEVILTFKKSKNLFDLDQYD